MAHERHIKDAGKWGKNKKIFVVNELVDVKLPFDESSKNSKKLALLWSPGFVITKRLHPLKYQVQKLDRITWKRLPKFRTMYIGDLRPSLEIAHQFRRDLKWPWETNI